MVKVPRPARIDAARLWSTGFAAAAGVIGAVVVAGWAFDAPLLKSIIPGAIVMKANTALAICAAAGGALLLVWGGWRGARYVLAGCSVFIIVLSGTAVAEYLWGWDAGLDQLFFRELPGAIFTTSPGRMAMTTALGLLLIGASLLLRDVPRWSMLVDVLVLGALLIAEFGMMVAIYGVDLVVGGTATSQIAPVSAFAMMMLGLAVAISRPGSGTMQFVTSETTAGRASRVLLPAALLTPLAAASLHVLGGRLGVYPEQYGVALIAFLNSVLFLLLVVVGLRSLVGVGEQLRAREQRFSALIEHSAEAIALIGAGGNVIYATKSSEALLGYSFAEFLGHNVLEFVHPEDQTAVREALGRIHPGGGPVRIVARLRHKDGRWRWIEATGSGLPAGSSDAAMVVNYRDISEQRRAEEGLLQMATAVSQAADTVVITDVNGIVQYVNAAFERTTGFTPAEVIGRNPRILKSGAHDAAFYQSLWGTITGGNVWSGRLINRRKDGSLYEEEATISPVLDQQGRIANFIAVKQDITARVRAEESLHALLEEKEVLIKEIHHRLKNNMQVIASMLHLQSVSIVDERDRAIFLESQTRVRSMALVHELLYRSNDLARIDLAVYARTLAEALFATYGADPALIALEFDLHPMPLAIDTAIPTGLIVNELVSNAMKHAFPDGRRGKITLSVGPYENNRFTVTVADDGLGVPSTIDIFNTPTLGLQLVTTLSQQLGGTVALDRQRGSSFTIVAPC